MSRVTPRSTSTRATCGRPSAPPCAAAITSASSMATPKRRSRATICSARRWRAARVVARNVSSCTWPGGRKYPSTCSSPHGARTLNSHPGTTRTPTSSPVLVASATPAVVSWSVSAIAASAASGLRCPTGEYRVKRRRRSGPVPCWNTSPNSSRPYTVTRPDGNTSQRSPSTAIVRCAIAALHVRHGRERDLGPQLPGVGGVGAQALQPLLKLDLLGQARCLGAMRHLGLAFGELGEQLRVLRVPVQPDALAAGLGELAQLAQGRDVVRLVGRRHPHACRGEHLGHG